MASLLRSRKFWLAVFGLVQSVVLNYFSFPPELWQAIDALIMVLISMIAVEDAAMKLGGRKFGG